MINVLNWLLIGLFGLPFLYLSVLSVLAFGVRRKRRYGSSRIRRFAIVVPAHNEEKCIVRTLKSLEAITYPRDHALIVVVADNCADGTAGLASGRGATVLERSDVVLRGKGYALEWAFKQLLDSPAGYDAVVVIDADTVVSQNLLLVLNEYLEEGHSALQVADVPEAQPGVWSSEVVRIGMTLYNVARPLGRRMLGFSAGLRGNGMCFSADLLRDIPWEAYSLTEDLEYGLHLLLKGVNVTFVPEVGAYTTLPSQLSTTQRERWEAGRYSVVKGYAWKLVQEFKRTGSFKLLDALADLLIPPFVNAFAAAGVLAFLAAALFAAGMIDSPGVLWGWGGVLIAGGMHVVLGLMAAQADRHLFRALAYVPRYAAWKVSLYASLLMHGFRRDWIRTTRE